MTVARVVPSNARVYAVIAVLMTVSLVVQVARDRGWEPYAPPSGVMWIRSGALAERLALGFDNLVADVYWMRTVVYFGGERLSTRARNFDQLYPLLDLVTSLDPHFRVAYRFGAIFLAEAYPGGAGRPDLAIALLEKGAATDPGRWEYLQDIGFVHYWWRQDYVQAAQWFRRASEVQGAPEWLAPLAATTLVEGGNRQSSRRLWTELRDQSDIEWVRSSAARRLDQLDAMDAIDQLQAIVSAFTAKYGRPPAEWQELARTQGWHSVPVDPSGIRYSLDPATGRVDVARDSTLWPLPEAKPPGVP